MRKAKDIIKGCEHDGSYIPVNEVLRLIKLAQEDAIRETVQACADNAETEEIEVSESIHGGSSYIYSIVDKSSILEVADKLIKEL